MKNKIFKFIIGLAIFGMPLAACGSSSGNNQPSVDPTPTPTPTPIDPDPKTVTDRDAFLEAASKVRDPGYKSAEVTYRNSYDHKSISCEGRFANDNDGWRYYGDNPGGDTGSAINEALEILCTRAAQVAHGTVWGEADKETHSYYMDATGFKFVATMRTDYEGVNYEGNLEAIFDSYGYLVKATETLSERSSVTSETLMDMAFHATYSTKELTPGPGPSPEGNITEDQWMEWAYSVNDIDAGYRNAQVEISDGMGYQSEVILYSHTGVHSDWHFYDGDKNFAEIALSYVSLSPDQITSPSIGGDISYNKNGDGSSTAYVHMETADFTLDAEYKFDANGYITYYDIVNDLSIGKIEVCIDIYYGTEDYPDPEPPTPEEGNMSRAEWIEYANSVEDIHHDYKSATLEGYYFVTNQFSYSGVCYFENEGTAESPSWVYNSGEKEIASAAIGLNVLLDRPSQLIPPDSWDEGKVIYNFLEDGYYRVDVILSEEQLSYVIFDEDGYVNEYFVYQTYGEQEMRFFAKVEFSYEPLTPVDPQSETGYGLMVNGVTYPMTVNPYNDSEYMALGVKVHAGDKVKFYNYEDQESWVITNLDSASQGFVVTDTGLYCQDTGRYDFFLTLSWGNDQVYVGYTNVEDYPVGELSFDEFKAAAGNRNPMYHPYDYCDCEYTVGSTVYNATFVWDEQNMAWKFYDGSKECPNPKGSDIQSFISDFASLANNGFTPSFYSDGTIIRASLSYMPYFSFDVSWNLYGLMTYYHTEGMGEDPSTIIFTYYNLI